MDDLIDSGCVLIPPLQLKCSEVKQNGSCMNCVLYGTTCQYRVSRTRKHRAKKSNSDTSENETDVLAVEAKASSRSDGDSKAQTRSSKAFQLLPFVEEEPIASVPTGECNHTQYIILSL
jgi:hypothetical protein